MAMRFTVLASGSAGNASLVEVDGFGVLLDAGLGPRQLAARLAAAGSSWRSVHALVLTHTHSDHWQERTLGQFTFRGVPVYCHAEQRAILARCSPAASHLDARGLLRCYEANTPIALGGGLVCRPLPVRHDGGPTFGFRFEGPNDLFGEAPTLGYAADLGSWDENLVEALCNADVLALEFNHDVELELSSGRQPRLIARVLGDEGHLSNVQGAALLRAVLSRSTAGRLRTLVQLHLSRDCNRPALAAAVAREALADHSAPVEVITASQHVPTQTIWLTDPVPGKRVRRPVARRRARLSLRVQPWLPGLEEAG